MNSKDSAAAGAQRRVDDLLRDARALADEDEAAATWVLFHALQEALNAYYQGNQRTAVTPAQVLNDLRAHAPEIEPRVRRILSSRSTVRSRSLWLEEFVREALSPSGGGRGPE